MRFAQLELSRRKISSLFDNLELSLKHNLMLKYNKEYMWSELESCGKFIMLFYYLFSINYFLFKMNISNNVTFEIVINNTNSFDNFNKSTKNVYSWSG